MNPDVDHELLEAVAQRRGPVLLVGAWASKTILSAARISPEVSVIALTEADAARVRQLAAAEGMAIRVYLPSAAVDPLADRVPETGVVRWTPELLGPIPPLSRVAVVGLKDAALAAIPLLPSDATVIVPRQTAGDVVDSTLPSERPSRAAGALEAVAAAIRSLG